MKITNDNWHRLHLLSSFKSLVYFLGSLQRPMGELRTHGSHPRRSGFLSGLFDQGKTLGLIADGGSNPGHHIIIRKRRTDNKVEKLVKSLLKRMQNSRFKNLNIWFLLKIIPRNLPLSASLNFLFKQSKNFIFLLGLHIRIFHSLAFSSSF